MPKRHGSVDSYRYGFQGQEKDDEIKGEGNSINYKFRMHDPRVGRFFASDPLERLYVHNSPYAFSENRVIDGVELEGLEYITRVHKVNDNGDIVSTSSFVYYKMSEESIEKMGGTPAGFYNSASHGELGEGTRHIYVKHNKIIAERWDLPRTNTKQAIATHGLYSGGGSITRNGFSKSYDFGWQPIDIADAIAKEHDMAYADAIPFDSNNYSGFIEDVRTLQADLIMLARIDQVMAGLKWDDMGLEEPLRKDIPGETTSALLGQSAMIGLLAEYKMWKITQPNQGSNVSILIESDVQRFINDTGGSGWNNAINRAVQEVKIRILQEIEKGRLEEEKESKKQDKKLKEKLKNG